MLENLLRTVSNSVILHENRRDECKLMQWPVTEILWKIVSSKEINYLRFLLMDNKIIIMLSLIT